MSGSNPVRPLARMATLGAFFALFGCASAETLPPGVSPQPMPQGADWQGVYQGPDHIFLQITRAGTHAAGRWRSMGGREGELWGDLDGNIMKFTWSEQDVQSKATWSGHGYFVYRLKEPGDVSEIRGQWGLGMSDTDGSWYAVKHPEVPLDNVEVNLADMDTGPGEDKSSLDNNCMGAACVGDDRDLSQ
ncbi:MAG TPA: hypothetical protein VF103_09665 [Polyangiaceae bacterium]